MKPISQDDIESGTLYFRGEKATHLAQKYDFEHVFFLITTGRHPEEQELSILQKRMQSLRKDAGLFVVPEGVESVTLLPLTDQLDTVRDKLRLDLYETLLYFVAVAPYTVAAQWRSMRNLESVLPRDDLSHCANFLWTLHRQVPEPDDLNDFKTAFVLHMDHPSNPSLTELVRSIDRGLYLPEALAGAIRSQDSPLHHGAGYEVMKMLLKLRAESDIEKYIRSMLKRGERVFGMGHRIYKTIDPRAIVLRDILERRTRNRPDRWLYDTARKVSRVAQKVIQEIKGVELFPNIDLYNAAVYHSLGIPIELNTALFSASRTAGWMAHILDNL